MLIIKSRRKRPLGLERALEARIAQAAGDAPRLPRARFRHGRGDGGRAGDARRVARLRVRRRPRCRLTSEYLADPAHDICNIRDGAGRIPFICFDLAGGANIAGSNVLVGKEGGQLDFLSTQGYSKLGLPGNMLPNNATTNFINAEFGLAFHSDSAFLRGMLEKTSPTTRANVNGAVIAARSENDTGNNPHNPMYGIAKTGSRGSC